MNGEIIKLAKRICDENVDVNIDVAKYAEQLNMLYGAIYKMDGFREEMINEIVEIENSRIKIHGIGIVDMIKGPEKLIHVYSKIAFNLAMKSFQNNQNFMVVTLLEKVLTTVADSSLLSETEKSQLAMTVSETILDFRFANGNHEISSLRMAPMIRG